MAPMPAPPASLIVPAYENFLADFSAPTSPRALPDDAALRSTSRERRWAICEHGWVEGECVAPCTRAHSLLARCPRRQTAALYSWRSCRYSRRLAMVQYLRINSPYRRLMPTRRPSSLALSARVLPISCSSNDPLHHGEKEYHRRRVTCPRRSQRLPERCTSRERWSSRPQ